MTLKKLAAHIKYRLTRIKTYVGILLAAAWAAYPFMAGTPYADKASYAMAGLAALFSFVGGNPQEVTNADSNPSLGE